MNTVQLTLTVDEVNVILSGLGELPSKTSINLILKIQADASRQIQEAKAATESKPE